MGRIPLPFPTASAWRLIFVALGLFGAAVNTGNNLIYLLFSLLVATFPVSLVLGALNLNGLRLDLRVPPAPRAGSPFTFEVGLTVVRRWPALRAVEVTIVTDRGEFGPVFVERIPANVKTAITFPARSARRGPMRIIDVTVRSTVPFGLTRREKVFKRADEVLILPSADRPSPRSERASLTAGGQALSSRVAGTEYVSLRLGTADDDARKVDWKVTARRGVTIVRETAGESHREIRLNVQTRWTGNPRRSSARFEKHVSGIAGQARQAVESGSMVLLSQDGASVRGYSGRSGLLQLLRRLARITPTTEDGTPLPPPATEPRQVRTVQENPRGTPAGRAHRFAAALALAISAGALTLGDGVSAAFLAVVSVSLILSSYFTALVTRERSIGSRLWKVAAFISLIAYFVDIVAIRRDLLAASLNLTVFVTLFAIFNARNTEDDRRMLVVSFLHIVLASAMTTEAVLALPLLGWMTAAAYTLIARTALPDAHMPHRASSVFHVDAALLGEFDGIRAPHRPCGSRP